VPIYDYLCDKCGEIVEKLASPSVSEIGCKCGGIMQRQIGMPRVMLDGTNPDFPGAYEKWARDRERAAEKHRKKSYYEG